MCSMCRGTDTLLIKDQATRLHNINCNNCGASRYEAHRDEYDFICAALQHPIKTLYLSLRACVRNDPFHHSSLSHDYSCFLRLRIRHLMRFLRRFSDLTYFQDRPDTKRDRFRPCHYDAGNLTMTQTEIIMILECRHATKYRLLRMTRAIHVETTTPTHPLCLIRSISSASSVFSGLSMPLHFLQLRTASDTFWHRTLSGIWKECDPGSDTVCT